MIKWLTLPYSICLLFLLTNCQTAEKPSPGPQWASQMQEFSHHLSEIYPYVVSEEAFNSPKNYSKIEESTLRLATLAQDLKNNKNKATLIDADPSLGFISKSFSREMGTAVEGLQLGKRDYSRYILKNATNYCIQCHSRGKWGPEQNHLETKSSLKTLRPSERAEILTAARNYAEALKVYRAILNDQALLDSQSSQWLAAAKNSMNILVRVQQHPKKAIELNRILVGKAQNKPLLRKTFQRWGDTLDQWKSERTKGEILDRFKLRRAKGLIKVANERQNSSLPDGEFVLNLRASAIVHDFLRSHPPAGQRAEAFYLLGQTYEATRTGKFMTLNEFYYKACIHDKSHSKLAEKCYDRFEASLFSDFSGGSGLAMPPSALRYLNYLKELAQRN